jgi:hypothetical protein
MEAGINLIIQIVAGALAGNGVASAVKNADMGSTWNSIAGALGGIGGGMLLPALTGLGATAAGGMDIGAIIGQVVGGGVGGAIVTVVVGMIKNSMQKA